MEYWVELDIKAISSSSKIQSFIVGGNPLN